MKILIVDDDPTSRMLLEKTLADLGPCRLACDGVEALEAFSAAHADGEPYDLILLDIDMPGLDGSEALRRIRSFEEARGIFGTDKVKISMATVKREARDVLGSFRDACDGYIVKPYSQKSVVDDLKRDGIL